MSEFEQIVSQFSPVEFADDAEIRWLFKQIIQREWRPDGQS